MQSWIPDLSQTEGPKYIAIAKALSRDIEAGSLSGGARLPPQRELAQALGVDLTTVTRAYREAQRLGLIEGQGRRGSFVRKTSDAQIRIEYKVSSDTGMIAPPELPSGDLADEYRKAVNDLLSTSGQSPPFQYQPSGGMAVVRSAGVTLLSSLGIPCNEDSVLVAAGGQNALHAILSAEMSPGDVLGVGGFVYPGLLALARRYGLSLEVIETDGEGMLPDALRAACQREKVRAAYVVPTNDNPTTATMSLERRHAIASVAREYGVLIFEDDAYGLLPREPLPPIASIAPELTWHIASVSKILTPGLRVAWLAAPDVARAWRLAGDMHETAVMAPPLNGAVVASWLERGTFHRLVEATRVETEARQDIARACLAGRTYLMQKEGYHLWMPLDADVSTAEILNTLRPHGLSIVASDAFAVSTPTPTRALRISIGGTITRERLERSLRLLGALTSPEASRKFALI